MPKPTVLVTEQEYAKAAAVFDQAPGLCCIAAPADEAALARRVVELGARHAVVGVSRYRDQLYGALPRGGVIARFGVGHDGIDKAKATSRGLLCTNTPGALDQSVAEHTLLLIAAAARHAVTLAAQMRREAWQPRVGVELSGRRLAIIGCGPIGRAVARIAAFGYGMRVTGCDPVVACAPGMGFDDIVTEFADAVAGADFVSLHIPATPATAHIVNERRLAQVPAGAWLINTARGSVVDEVALYDALEGKRLAGAALDVFEREPYEPACASRDLRRLDNVILTPHVGSNTTEANARMAQRSLRNIALAESREFPEMDLLNADVLLAGKNGIV